MKRPKVYRDRRPLKILLWVLAALAALALALCVFAIFWCRQYIVVEDGRLRLDPPWPYASEGQPLDDR